MPPIRRYLRITAHSVLEVRIYLDNPADASRWLLNPRDPVLPRVIEAVRPLVLPKLREENERAGGRAKVAKRKGVKDVVVRDEFEVSIFLTELSTPHAILTRGRTFKGKKKRLGDKGEKMTGTREEPLEIADAGGGGGEDEDGPITIREESEEEERLTLGTIPAARHEGGGSGEEDGGGEGRLPSNYNSTRESVDRPQAVKSEDGHDADADDKKKLAMDTRYEGFQIYGRILCLVVKRKARATGQPLVGGVGQAVMEEWISSTQMAEGRMMDD